MPNHTQISEILLSGLNSNEGGASVFWHTTERPTIGFLVSIRKYNKRISPPGNQAAVTKWVKRNLAFGTVLGSWDEGSGVWHLDVNEWFMVAERAWIMGAIEGEEAIYDLAKGKQVDIPQELVNDQAFRSAVDSIRLVTALESWPYGPLPKN